MSVSTVFGLGILAAGIVATRFVHRAFVQQHLSSAWMRAEIIAVVTGVALGVGAVAYSRYPTPDVRLLGFPFLAAVFERSPGGGWADFLGVGTLPATVGNFVVGLFLPQFFIAAAAWMRARRTHESV